MQESVAVDTTKFLFIMCDCAVDTDVNTGDFSLVRGVLPVCDARAITRVSVHGLELETSAKSCYSK